MTWTRGAGSLRERRPGVWEVRVALGPDLVSGRTAVRSLTVHGDRQAAEDARARWAAQAALVRSNRRARPGITLGELLEDWLAAEHAWRPSTLAGYRSTVAYLVGDLLASRRAVELSPSVLRAACAAWRGRGCPDPTIWAARSGSSFGVGLGSRRAGPGPTPAGRDARPATDRGSYARPGRGGPPHHRPCRPSRSRCRGHS